jgi:response regulator RpfG family c-di-GMP phosphodiesterase
MSTKPIHVMLVDDNHDDNFFHERAVKKSNPANIVITQNTAISALEYIRKREQPLPDLIFLDINMPAMNGWEFLNEYNKLQTDLSNSVVVIMLTTSGNPDDKAKAQSWNFISDYVTKPLTKDLVDEISKKYFEE